METAGEALRRARKREGLYANYVAAELGISTSYMHDIEIGRRAFPKQRIHLLPPVIRADVVNALLAEVEWLRSDLERARDG